MTHDLNYNWACCPNCGADEKHLVVSTKIQNGKIVSRLTYCQKCNLLIRECFAEVVWVAPDFNEKLGKTVIDA